ncbi:AAA family ATPase [Eubacteriaceae bacterium ES3]|nr:AAA family ATPase [Eubacteriaceae bacterium ES3]
MKDIIVRICTIEINNIKNVCYGKIDHLGKLAEPIDEMNADILGIYGQNGSGKTAVIEVLDFLKRLMSGSSLPPEIMNYLTKGEKSAECQFSFWISHNGDAFNFDYRFKIQNSENRPAITEEKLFFKRALTDSQVVKLEYQIDNQELLFTPQEQFNALIQNNQDRFIDAAVAKKLAFKECRSFFFSDELLHLLETADIPDLSLLLTILKRYATKNLFVIKSIHSSFINLNMVMPFSFIQEYDNRDVFGDLPISLSEPSIFPQKTFQLLQQIIESINLVITAMIPDMALTVKNYGPQMTASGEEGIRFEILSVRNQHQVPLRYESEGIKKILSILNLLIAVYHFPGICVAIDELDAGVYEYLLGELLEVLEKNGKGQLLFTSHNLRPLEMIHKSSMLFTTTNAQNRYIRFSEDNGDNNMRDLYLRTINLGGQREEIYASTNVFEISRAFRKAGRLLHD